MLVPLDGTGVYFERPNTGGFGALGVNDTSAHTPSAAEPFAATQLCWIAFTALEDTVFTTLTPVSATKTPVSGITGLTIPAGVTHCGYYSTFTLASGSVIAYQGPAL